MSFIRAKEIPKGSGNWYDYEVETVHDNGKVIQRHIQYLGKSGTPHNKPLLGHKSKSDLLGATASPNISVQPKAKVVCKFCDSQNTRKYGLYKGIQNYFCDDCHTKFTGTDAVSHGRVSPSLDTRTPASIGECLITTKSCKNLVTGTIELT